MFEIRHKDGAGRAGVFNVHGKKLETPYLFPVINPKQQVLGIEEIARLGFDGIITNSYIIYRDPVLRQRALEQGIHALLDFEGVVMTDSGSFQLYQYGSVEVSPREIVHFQDEIGVDIGVILDIPTPPDVPYERAKQELEETLRRAGEASRLDRKMLLAGTVQGSTHAELRERAASEVAKLAFDVHAIGGVVPLMEDYRFAELARVILHAKRKLGHAKPVHLFGAGHPMVFALASLLGCDLFDSAAYALYARDGRYITARGTYRVGELRELPCSCEVCSAYDAREFRSLEAEEGERLLAKHNLIACLEEIKKVKQAIYEGSLWELAEQRARAHPSLLEALRILRDYSPQLERLEPVTKRSAFFYTGMESLSRPAVARHIERLSWIERLGKELVLLPEGTRPYSRTYRLASSERYHICIASPVFGVIPLEVEETYPLTQHEGVGTLDADQLAFMRRIISGYLRRFTQVHWHRSLEFLGLGGEGFEDLSQFRVAGGEELKLRALADYQLGRGAGEVLFAGARAEYSRRTGRIRRAFVDGQLVATLRASDGMVVPTIAGGERLLRLQYPRCRVVVAGEVSSFVKEGKSVFAKFVVDCDPEIRAHQEVVVVDEDDELLATGTAMLSAGEMLEFERGMAVKTRHRRH
ncbi:tRNA guanosine(15) transglycosylase TgtA [Candidatus Pyrohabitans sp.]